MTEAQIQLLDDLGAEFARVSAGRRHVPRRRFRRMRDASPARAAAVAVLVLVAIGLAAYAVPPTRAAIDDLTGTFAGWFEGSERAAPGRALRPGDDAPDWIRDADTRVIAAKAGVKLYVARSESDEGPYLSIALDRAIATGATIEDWRRKFEDHAVLVLGMTALGKRDFLDDRGRAPIMGLTARSVERVELRYLDRPPVVETGLDGGFILMTEAWRTPSELIAYDAAGTVLERVDVRDLDLEYLCDKEPGCPATR